MKPKLLLLLAALVPFPALAYEQPSVNLGFTSFVDGGPPAGPGWYFQQYLQWWSADKFTDAGGGHAFGPFRPELDAWISLTQVIYQSDQDLLGGKWGVNVILPLVSLDLKADGLPLSTNSGVGDLLVGPFIQWGPVMGDQGPRYMHRIELQMIFPTGTYSSAHAINAGSNFFSFNPYWSGTVFLGPRWTASTRLHLLYNARNDSPPAVTGLDSFRAGMAVHANFAVSYALIEQRLRVGLNGFFFEQIQNTKVDGVKASGLKERVWAAGPGMLYSFSQDNHLFLNAYIETAAENRPRGTRLSARWVSHF